MTTNSTITAVRFDVVNVTSNSAFNTSDMSVAVQNSSSVSLYWMHIAVDVPPYTPTHVKISDSSLSIFANQTITNVIVTLAMNGIISIKPSNTIKLITASSSLATYWTGFRVDNLFCPLVAFRVVRNAPLTAAIQISFDVVLVNEGNAWNASANMFIAPYDGVYLFSQSGGIRYNTPAYIDLYLNGLIHRRAGGGLGQHFSAGVDMLSKTTVLNLKTNDYIYVKLNNNNYLYSDPINHQIAFSGFYYSPTSTQQVSLAWQSSE